MSRDATRIAGFLLLAFGGAWSIWALAWLLDVFDTSVAGQLIVAVGALSPAIASIVVRWLSREGFADAGLRPNLRNRTLYYAVAWLLPLPVLGVVIALAAALGLPFANRDLPPTAVVTALLAAVLVAPLFFGEELGWRGYLHGACLGGVPFPRHPRGVRGLRERRPRSRDVPGFHRIAVGDLRLAARTGRKHLGDMPRALGIELRRGVAKRLPVRRERVVHSDKLRRGPHVDSARCHLRLDRSHRTPHDRPHRGPSSRATIDFRPVETPRPK